MPKTHRKVLKTSNLAYTMLLAGTGKNFAKIWLSDVPIGCVRFARHCGKMYSRHLFSSPWIACTCSYYAQYISSESIVTKRQNNIDNISCIYF